MYPRLAQICALIIDRHHKDGTIYRFCLWTDLEKQLGKAGLSVERFALAVGGIEKEIPANEAEAALEQILQGDV